MSEDEDRESEFESAESDDDNDSQIGIVERRVDGPTATAGDDVAPHPKARPSHLTSSPSVGTPDLGRSVSNEDVRGCTDGHSSTAIESGVSANAQLNALRIASLNETTATNEQLSSSSNLIGSGQDDDAVNEIATKVEDTDGWEVDSCDVDVGETDSRHASEELKERLQCDKTKEVDELEGKQCEKPKVSDPEEGFTGESTNAQTSTSFKETKTTTTTALLDKLSEAADGSEKGSSWGWGSWGASVLSTASSSVATFTSQFEQGLNSVLETVESSLGAPSPEELASHHRHKSINLDDASSSGEKEPVEVDSNENDGDLQPDGNLIGSLVSGVSSSFTNVLDNKVISGGLDTLELIGRKTMDILQDGDPGLKKKRALLERSKPCLSEVLREAKENADLQLSSTNPDNSTKTRVHFGTIFDHHQGFVHLEALEMLSNQIEQRVQLELLDLTGEELNGVQSELKRIENDCLLDSAEDDEDVALHQDDDMDTFADRLVENFKKLNVSVNLDKLTKVQVDGQSWLRCCQVEQDKRETSKDAEEIHESAITFLAEFTAKTIEVLHKTSELILVSESQDDNPNILSSFVNACCVEISVQSSRYSACLNTAADDSDNPESISPLITNVYLEASNSETYIQDAFRLVVPIFQLMFLKYKTS